MEIGFRRVKYICTEEFNFNKKEIAEDEIKKVFNKKMFKVILRLEKANLEKALKEKKVSS